MFDPKSELARLRREGLARQVRERSTRAGPRVRFAGGPGLLNFCSNDYLGLSGHPEILEAARRGISRWGWGAGAARLVTGTTSPHLRLEEGLAAFHHRPAALLFGTGYQANVGALQAQIGPGDLVLSDALNHASLIDGCRLAVATSGAEVRVYRHGDLGHLEGLLKAAKRRRGRRWIVTDALFSVDGDAAPLEGIAALAARYGALTFVDEAHAIGVFGRQGRGLVHALGLSNRLDVVVGTLSKALGGVGGWVSGSKGMVSLLRSRARAFLYSTAPPMAAAEAALAALVLCRGPQGDVLRQRLWANVRILGAPGPILSLPFQGVGEAGRVSKSLERKGYFVAALRPPTVPAGTSRLRVVATAAHTPGQVRGLLRALGKGGRA